MPFTEICIYQVKPQKIEEFESLMLEARSFLEKQPGLLTLRLVKRGIILTWNRSEKVFPAGDHARSKMRQVHALLGI